LIPGHGEDLSLVLSVEKLLHLVLAARQVRQGLAQLLAERPRLASFGW
jgi:hypothetical protein